MSLDELLRKLRSIGANPFKVWIPGPMARFILAQAENAGNNGEGESPEDDD